jgi:hypothetical protein
LKQIRYLDFIYDNIILDEVNFYEYLGANFHYKLNWKYGLGNNIMEIGKLTLVLRTIVKRNNIDYEKKGPFDIVATPMILYGCQV